YQRNGGLADPVVIPNTGWPYLTEIADMNGDGRNDIIAKTAYRVFLARNDGGGNFTISTVTEDYSQDIQAGDVTSDGRPDVVTLYDGGANVSVYPQLTNGTFGTAIRYPLLVPWQTYSAGIAL